MKVTLWRPFQLFRLLDIDLLKYLDLVNNFQQPATGAIARF